MAPLLVTLRTETEETPDTEVSRSASCCEGLEGGSYAKDLAGPKASREKEERKRESEEHDTGREGGEGWDRSPG